MVGGSNGYDHDDSGGDGGSDNDCWTVQKQIKLENFCSTGLT